jgi:outer membrane murein-binding lipoprotein Lpp
MKKAAGFELIGGYPVFAGIVSEAVINPAKTMELVDLQAAGLPARKKIAGLEEARNAAAEKARAAYKDAEIAKKNKDREAFEKAMILYTRARQKIDEADKESLVLYRELEKERERLFYENAVYFDPPGNAVLLEETDALALARKFSQLPERTALTVQGEAIPDFRGVAYWAKDKEGAWEKYTMETLGEKLPKNAVLDEAFPAEQRREYEARLEKDRVAALPPEEKAEELLRKLDRAADEAILKEGRARLRGEPFDARAYYDERKAELETKYA